MTTNITLHGFAVTTRDTSSGVIAEIEHIRTGHIFTTTPNHPNDDSAILAAKSLINKHKHDPQIRERRARCAR